MQGGLRYEGEAGAPNESFADVFATMVLQHSLNQTVYQASWLIGEKVLKSESKGRAKKMGLRSLLAPGTAYITRASATIRNPGIISGMTLRSRCIIIPLSPTMLFIC